MYDFFDWLHEKWDSMFMSDREWKKKNCPYLYNYLFQMTDEERHDVWTNYDDDNAASIIEDR